MVATVILGSVASFLAATHVTVTLKGTASSGISTQLRDIFFICRCFWNVATYKWKVHNGKFEMISFVVKLPP
jgi:hypothetical protein